MSAKRGAADANDERPISRQRIEEETADFVPSSLDDINDHCVLEILRYLSVEEELNSIVVFISQRYRELRNHDSLDQTRTGTIVCTEHTSPASIRNAFVAQGWNQVFTGNRTRMKVVGLERILAFDGTPVQRSPDYVLPNVSSLDMSFNPLDANRNVHRERVLAFVQLLPNLENLDLSYMNTTGGTFLYVRNSCPKLQRLYFNGSQKSMGLEGSGITMSFAPLTELFIDDSQLWAIYPNAGATYSLDVSQRPPGLYMFRNFPYLERLSIRNATWYASLSLVAPTPTGISMVVETISQEMLINMVRHHPSLRWLRSDLTEENIAMLQEERPGITFVSE